MFKERELLCLFEIALAYKMLPANWQDEIAKPEAKIKAELEQQMSPVEDTDDDTIPPRQMRLFDD